MKNTNYVAKFVEYCIRNRVYAATSIAVITIIMGIFASRIEIKTIFNDLLPTNHEYIKVNDKFKSTFGGSNMVSIMVEVENGDIFNSKVLGIVQNITSGLQQVDGVNQYQVISIASKKLKEIRSSTEGIELKPLMWPDLPKNESELMALRESVLKNPLVYGAYVSRDLKAALITVDFYDQLLNYDIAFKQINELVSKVKSDGVNIRVIGEPILYGLVSYKLSETITIFISTILSLVVLLFLFARTWRGTVLPLIAGVVSCIWALGAARLIGFNLDPLVIVIAFLITARSISHSVQLVTRFEDEMNRGSKSCQAAASASMYELFRPGMLGVIADAGCMLVVILTPIPLLHKVAIIGTIWVSTIAISAVVLTPVLLTWVKSTTGYSHPINVAPFLDKATNLCITLVSSRWRYFILGSTAIVFVISGIYAFNLKVGDANPGSPILWPDSKYNLDAQAINEKFQGSDRMFVVFSGNKENAVTSPTVLENMVGFQKFMEAQPEIGGSIAITDVIPAMKRILREDNPRYQEFGNDDNENGELLYLFVSGTEPGDIDRFADAKYTNAAITMNFRDHQGETIRTAVARINEYISNNKLAEGSYKLAGGLIGVLAAVNEVILAGQIESIALALLVLLICCTVTYRSTTAGLFFMVPVVVSNTLTFSYMAIKGIGMNINTLPVAALGIGLGVDYSFYIIDGIREEIRKHGDLKLAVSKSLSSAGRGVVITATTLIISIFFWCFSGLRFQAEMGILMAIWLTVSTCSALLLMPSMVFIFRPEFVVGTEAVPKTNDDLSIAQVAEPVQVEDFI